MHINIIIAAIWQTLWFRILAVLITILIIAGILSWLYRNRLYQLNLKNLLEKEKAQQALDKERLDKEIEIERSQLMSQQKVVLEKEVAERTVELKESLEGLKSTQKQQTAFSKNGIIGRTDCRHCPRDPEPFEFCE